MQPNFTYATAARATSIIQQAFAWMFGGLMVTAVTALAAASDPNVQRALQTNPLIMIGLMIAEFGLVIFLASRIQQMSHSTAVGAFIVFAALNGVLCSDIFLRYTGSSIFGAFLSTSLIFGVMALYGFATKKDLSSVGSLAIMMLFGLIIASVVNAFLQSTALMWLLSYATIGIFCALTAYDTQKLKVMSTQMEGTNLGIYGALSLYLDFINIFLALLRIFGGGRNN